MLFAIGERVVIFAFAIVLFLIGRQFYVLSQIRNPNALENIEILRKLYYRILDLDIDLWAYEYYDFFELVHEVADLAALYIDVAYPLCDQSLRASYVYRVL